MSPIIITYPEPTVGATANEAYPILASYGSGPVVKPKLNFVVCFSGAVEEQLLADCGQVLQLTSAQYTTKVKVTGLVEVNYCYGLTGRNQKPGDSGALIYKNFVAYGMEVSGSGCFGKYQPISSASEALHVHVLTPSG